MTDTPSEAGRDGGGFFGGFFLGASLWTVLACLLEWNDLGSPATARLALTGAAATTVAGVLALLSWRAGARSPLQFVAGFVVAAAAGALAGGASVLANPALLQRRYEPPTWLQAEVESNEKAPASQKGGEEEVSLDRQTRRVVARVGRSYRALVPDGTVRMMLGIGGAPGDPPRGRVSVGFAGDREAPLWSEVFDLSERPKRWQDVTIELDRAGVELEIRVEALPELKRSGLLVSEPAFLRSPEGLRPRNLVLISLDTLRADMVGAYGYREFPTTPNLDALAERGTVFENYFSHSPWTTPSHMALLTGVLPDALGMSKRIGLNPRLARYRTTLAELFRDAGYLSVAFTGTATIAAQHGFSDGFYLQQEAYNSGLALMRDIYTNANLALDWLGKNLHQPLFLFFHTFEVHDPYLHQRFVSSDVPAKDRLRVAYASGIAFTDEYLGHFLDELDALGVLQDSVVVITSDHGDAFSTPPRHYHGRTLYDELLHVPLILVGEGVPEGVRVKAQVPEVDLFATLAELYGLELPADPDSRSLWPLIRGESNESRPVHLCCLSHYGPKLGLRRDGFKYVMTYREDGTVAEELYDLTRDPLEQTNLADEYGGLRREMRGEVLGTSLLNEQRAAATTAEAGGAMDPEEAEKLRALGYLE